MKIEGYHYVLWLTLKKLSKSCSLLVITPDINDEQQPRHSLNYKGEGYKPFRVIIDNATNNLMEERHQQTLEVRKTMLVRYWSIFYHVLIYFPQNTTGTSHHAKATQTESFPNVIPSQPTKRKK